MKILNSFPRLPSALSMLSIVFLASCAETDKVEATMSSLWDNKFSSCGTVCHSGNDDDLGTNLGPVLSSKSAFYNNLVNKSVNANYPDWVNSVSRTATCDSKYFIEPGDANNSTLAAAMLQSVSVAMESANACNTAYNFHSTKGHSISDQDTADALVKWINDGAKNN